MHRFLKTRLDEGENLLGLLVTIPSVPLVQVLAGTGFDFLLVDLEHSPTTPAELPGLIAACRPAGPLVRVPTGDSADAKRALDLGAVGVVFPQIPGAEAAAHQVAQLRYPPVGTRGWGPFIAPSAHRVDRATYVSEANHAVLAGLAIESRQAVREAEQIAKTPGLDLIFIAPYDLSMDLGVPGQFAAPAYLEAVETVESAVLERGVHLGGMARDRAGAEALFERGYRVVVLGYDVQLLEGAARRLLQHD